MKNDFDYVFITVTMKKIKGKWRRRYNIQLCPLETERFPWGLRLGTTFSEKRAELWAAEANAYMKAVIEVEKS